MVYRTKYVQDLCTIDTEIHEEVIQFALNERVFLQNVRNLRKSSLEAFVYVLLMRRRGKLPKSRREQEVRLDVADFIRIIHENNLRLQADGETFRWVLSAFALSVLAEEDVGAVQTPLAKLVTDIAAEYSELPLYYDVLRTLLILAKERPELCGIFSALEGENMIRRLACESSTIKMKALACLQTMMEFNPKLFDAWLRLLQSTTLAIEQRTFMLHQLLECLLRLEDRKADILQTIQCDHVWPIIIEGLATKVAVCRKEALATVQYIIGYAKQCGSNLNGTYFSWSQNNSQSERNLTNAWQSFVTIAETLNETQTHLILPALELIEKVAPLHGVWMNLLLRLILLHENPRVANFGLQYFLKHRSFDPTDMVLENQFLATFNQTTVCENVAELITALKEYYNQPNALAYVLNCTQDISWNSVPYYCIVNVIHDRVERLEIGETECSTHLKSLTGSLRACQDIKNVSLRYITVLLTLETISRYANRCRDVIDSGQLLSVVKEIEKLSPMFLMSPERFQDASGFSFCDAITDEALCLQMTEMCLEEDTFLVREILTKRITNATPSSQENLLSTLSKSNVSIYLNVLYQLPETVQRRWSNTVPVVAASQIAEMRHALETKALISSRLFSAIREVCKFISSPKKASINSGGLFADELRTILNDRLIVSDFSHIDTVETIQIAYLLTVDLGDYACAQRFFHTICLKQLKDTFRRDQTTIRSIDQIYTMISEIFLHHCRYICASDQRAFATEDDWSKLIVLLDVGNIDVLMHVLEILYTDSADGMGDHWDAARAIVVDRSYKEILNYRKSDHFMKLIKQFIVTLLRPYTKMVDFSDLDSVEIDPKVTGYVQMFLEQASTIYGLANLVFEAVFQIPVPILLNWSALGKLLLQGMIFGDVQKRDQRIENEVIDHSGLEISFKHHPRYFTQADARVRVLCVLFLYRIVKANHPDAVLFLLKLERMLMERFGQMTKAKERYYADSITHRQKLRIVQALCVVLKLTGTKPYPLLEVMLYETNQPNINYLIELIVADSTIDTLTIANSLRNEKVKVSGIQSVFVILWLRCCQTNSLDEKYIHLLLPWTMAQNFSTRLYAQITITKLIATFAPHPVEEGPLGAIYAAVNSYLRQGNVERNIEKCMKDFRFNSVFDYGNLLTVENIFHNIPKVSVAPAEDVVGTPVLRECLRSLGLGENNLGQALEFDEMPLEKRENLFLAQSFGGADFVQRKIVPLKSLEPSTELLLGLPENLCHKKMDFTEGLIVVASLVNRAPNLGGLARTSEIFAVKQFVINSLQDIDNKEFQALSMTAEKWLNVGELKAHKIVEYLEEMKSKGYAIVGAEQTTGSKPIQQLQFPKKCILVLGHEKNGLPAEIIRHLDLIGEIPQFGVVRSLNVHVTGAIFMWEYAKQHHVAPVVQ